MRRLLLHLPIGLMVAGCYPNKPDLPLLDEIPLKTCGTGEQFEFECPCRAAQLERRVACAVEGDTLSMDACDEELGEQVRLLGVDAPDLARGGEPAECWGVEAQQALGAMLAREFVNLSFDATCSDASGATLAYVSLPDDTQQDARDDLDGLSQEEIEDELDLEEAESLLVNEWLLATGNARYFNPEGDPDLRLTARLVNAEAVARSRHLGLWRTCGDPGE